MICQVEIADLNLSVRTFNAVCRAGIKTIPELYDKYQLEYEQLREIIGKHGFEEIGDALAKHREEVFAENRRAEKQEPLKPGDYLPDYDPELWGDAVTFDELTQMEGCLVIVNDAWYPEDCLETDGEGDVMCVCSADQDAVMLNDGSAKPYCITRQAMDDHVKCRTKVWKLNASVSPAVPENDPAVVVSEDYTRAVTLTRSIIANAQAAQHSLYEVCKGLKEMRDGKLYKELGYQNFEDYTENEVGIKRRQAYTYIQIATGLPTDFVQSTAQIGTEKLALLARLDEPTREAVTETVDVESVTVKELREQITALTAKCDEAKATIETKDKQFRQAMESKNNELTEVKTGWKRRSDTLLTKIAALQKELEEARSEPKEVAVEDTSRIEELQKQLEQAQAELAAANARLAERPMVQEALPVTDGRDAFKAYLSAAADSMKRLYAFIEQRRSDADFGFFIEKTKGVVSLAQSELTRLKGE